MTTLGESLAQIAEAYDVARGTSDPLYLGNATSGLIRAWFDLKTDEGHVIGHMLKGLVAYSMKEIFELKGRVYI